MIALLGCLWISDAEQAQRLGLDGKAGGRPDADTDSDTDSDTDTDSDRVGDIVLSARALEFDDVTEGESASLPLEVGNEGEADLTLANATLDTSSFSIEKVFDFPQVVAPGEAVTILARFKPTEATDYTGHLTLLSDDPDEAEEVVSLSGTGVESCSICAPRISVNTGGDPYAISDFFSVSGVPDTRTVTIGNEGDMPLSVVEVYVNNDVTSTCGEFSVRGWTATTALAPGESFYVSVSYHSTEECIEIANKALDQNVLHILSDDPAEPDYIIELSAMGL